MEFYEREFLISRIACGYHLIKIDDDLTIKIHPPTVDQNYRANLIFKSAYDEALIGGIMCPIESAEMLEQQDIWDEVKKKELKDLDKEVDDLKVQIYQEYFRTSGKTVTRIILREKEKQRQKLIEQKHSYDFANAAGIATFARWNWLIENTTTFEDNTPYDWKKASVQEVLMAFRKSQCLDEEVLRELARTEPWKSIWAASKHEGKLFGVKPTELTAEQKGLMAWSTLYDSVSESGEAPPDKVVEDNDALDGWMIVQSRKRKQSREKKLTEELLGKHPDAKDIFIKTETPEEAERVVSLNDLDAKRIRRRRTDKLKQEGTVSYHKFADVQRDLQDEIAAAGD